MIHEVYLDHIRTKEPARLASVVSGEVAVPVVRWLKTYFKLVLSIHQKNTKTNWLKSTLIVW
ncbi:MAG: hypothetical protein WAM27_09570 [Nitrososphaeraceae archaeon]